MKGQVPCLLKHGALCAFDIPQILRGFREGVICKLLPQKGIDVSLELVESSVVGSGQGEISRQV